MDGLLLPDERVEALEDGVDVTNGCVEIEDDREVDARRDLGVGGGELAEVAFLFPGLHRVALNQSISVVARNAGFDEREQQPVAENEPLARVEVAPHALGVD